MDPTRGYFPNSEMGGPMNISEGYRWNIPVVTYGFDQGFLNYFGTNGVAAAEKAFLILNSIPPASQINLTNYPMNPWQINYSAQAAALTDLKTTLLAALVEQLGLTTPSRYTFCIRDYFPIVTSNYYFAIIQRNFDPATYQPSPFVNDTLFTYQVTQYGPSPTQGVPFCDAMEINVDPLSNWDTSIFGNNYQGQGQGAFATTLSRDDIGGIRFLLSSARVRFESLPSDVETVNTNTPLVRSAYRPGIEKINFVRHSFSSLTGEFLPQTNQWTDVYYSGNNVYYQSVQRRLNQPDIIFTGRDLSTGILTRTTTTNWINHAAQNGNAGGPGPGVIQPHIKIELNNAAPVWTTMSFWLQRIVPSEATSSVLLRWGSFDSATNAPLLYPSGFAQFQPTEVRFKLAAAGRTNLFRWNLPGTANSRYSFQSSTNLISWSSLATITNTGAPFDYFHRAQTNESSRFFRLKAE